ncbi:restriction endonuclease subunit S [Streptomyces malaysiensis]|uniref:restriction endonuclease subunit S n=1 Tax=Streptomyces malaysiensis TaxID=92644 RepID=UPI002B2A199D|nr:restriction endonuclease subunit S [Streptomyces malaysiensis]
MSVTQIAPWLADSQWPTAPIRLVARLGSGHTPSRNKPEYWQDCAIPWITLADVWQLRSNQVDVITETKEKISKLGEANSAAVRHPAGTVILSRTASVGFSAIMGRDMATSQDFATWTCGPRLDPRFLLHALRAMAPDLKRIAAGSTHKTIYMPDVEQLRVPLPSLEVQRRISDFLDTETARIDQVRELRKQQMNMVDEGAISRAYAAVRGESVDGPRKDSKLSWLGTVPASWRVAAVSHHFEVELGKMLNEERAKGQHLRSYLRVANVQWDHVDVEELTQMNFPPDERRRYRLHAGDVLVCEGGSWPGRAAVWDGRVPEMYYQKALHRIRPRGTDLPRWLYYCLLVAERLRVFAVQGNASTMTHLTREQLRPQRFPFPEPATQRKLVEKLDAAAQTDREVKDLLQHQLDVLAERRQALITAAVTGRLDVTTARGVEAP